MNEAGFREHEHTADWELEVWAPDLPGLLKQAAEGMYALAQTELETSPRTTRTLVVSAPDPESLLVDFLGELLFLGEEDGLAFDHIEIEVSEGRLRANLEGAPIRFQAKEIKAVTYHNLSIRETGHGLVVRIVFDV